MAEKQEKKRSFSLDDYKSALDDKYGALEFDYGSGDVALCRYPMLVGSTRSAVTKILKQLQDKYVELSKAIEADDEDFDLASANDQIVGIKRDLLKKVAGNAAFDKWLDDQPEAGIEWLYDLYQDRTDLPEASASSSSSEPTAGASSQTSSDTTDSPS